MNANVWESLSVEIHCIIFKVKKQKKVLVSIEIELFFFLYPRMSIFTYGLLLLTCVFLQDKSQVKVKQLYLSLQEKFTASSHTHTQ